MPKYDVVSCESEEDQALDLTAVWQLTQTERPELRKRLETILKMVE